MPLYTGASEQTELRITQREDETVDEMINLDFVLWQMYASIIWFRVIERENFFIFKGSRWVILLDTQYGMSAFSADPTHLPRLIDNYSTGIWTSCEVAQK